MQSTNLLLSLYQFFFLCIPSGPIVTSSFYPCPAQNWHHTICTFCIPMLLPRILYVRCPTQTSSIVNKQAKKPPISNNEPRICSGTVQQPPMHGSLLLQQSSDMHQLSLNNPAPHHAATFIASIRWHSSRPINHLIQRS